MFRRRPDQAEAPAQTAEAPESTRPGYTPGKGRPTPKRSEAERRHGPYSAPSDRKGASADYRARQKAERGRRYAAMQRGEDWALPVKDRGPARALTRDYVDSRRRLSEYYMYALVVLMVLVFIKTPIVVSLIPGLVILLVLIMLVEGVFIGRKARKLAAERLPNENARGLGLYAAMRALQIRRLRMPKPRIRAGESF